MPVTGMTAPVSVGAEESVATDKPETRSPRAKARTDEEADAHWRNVYDRARRRCVVVPRGRSPGLHDLGARVRARSQNKPKCEDRQCGHTKFLPHDCYPSCFVAD